MAHAAGEFIRPRGHNSPAPPDAAPPGLLLVRRRNAGKRHTKRRVVEHAHVRHQRKGLKTIAIFLRRTSRSSASDILAISTPSISTAAGGFNQAIEKANHGGFPRAGEPHDDEYLAFFNGQTGVFDAKRQPRFSSICALLSPFSIYLKARVDARQISYKDF